MYSFVFFIGYFLGKPIYTIAIIGAFISTVDFILGWVDIHGDIYQSNRKGNEKVFDPKKKALQMLYEPLQDIITIFNKFKD